MHKIFIILMFFCLSGCLESDKSEFILGENMESTYSVNALGDERVPKDAIKKRLKQINAVFSHWQADSEISKLNSAPVGEWIQVSEELFQILQESKSIYIKTNGFFDPGIGHLLNLWGFGTEGDREDVPTRSEITKASESSSLKYLELGDRQVRKLKDVNLNLSAIAKGYAVDEVARLIEAKGVKDFLVEVEGKAYASGTKNGDDWTISVERPDNKELIPITLNNSSIATWGTDENYFIWEGEKYMHIFNPKTGLPANNDIASVSVIHPRSAIADAYTTAMMAMGSEKAIKLANELELSVLLIVIKADGYQIVKINLAD